MPIEKNFTDFYVILVEPKYSGNIGFISRTMMNFDFDKLILVKPCCKLDDECYTRAMHAYKIIDQAMIFQSFDEAVKDIDYLVATSSIESKTEKKHLRKALILEDFADKIFNVKGKIGLVFGREDYGLYNDEIAKCDIMMRIPTSNVYPSLNLSHAVSITLYTLYIRKKTTTKKKREIGRVEKEKLQEFFSTLLDEIDYPDHKKKNTEIMLRRIMGRAMPSKWEYHTLMGVLSKTLEKIKKS
ncbi:tRNA (cytosine(32)/uridine(32)-2'-O)-methyltransferase TrmJ [Euryarchaeota archaeon ex4484_162]|nr:MAG: tRNA (cytosine(32)/uridine(32)-2'-O)-methyltransferase TrmJ [Euryarchaeota archaeon ex4484_162]RLF29681.1 MAG: RNA methyltransferase [Thermoplasmata archaeon]RLF36634.1 MAG: RNA methyltransferase [Thermoplasmata archaeon]